jgi:DNA-binding NtrC family response regulator
LTRIDGAIFVISLAKTPINFFTDLPLEIQPKLVRFLQEGEIQPLGENHPIKTDVRIVAATNADLEQMVADGTFREDLYYRLNIIRLHVPPLKDRRSGIPALINHYVKVYSEKFDRRNITFAPPTIDILTVCEWQGNVRQLCNEIQRIIARAEDDSTITPEDISPELRTMPAAKPENIAKESLDYLDPQLPNAIEQLEKTMFTSVLERKNYNVSRSAKELGITRRGLQLKLGRYNFKRHSI